MVPAYPDEPVPPADASTFSVAPLTGRGHKAGVARFARVLPNSSDIGAFLDGLPDFLGARALRQLAGAIADAHTRGRSVYVGLGGHVVKVGLAPTWIDLARRGIVRGFVMNGAAAIHDAECALEGSTSEDVEAGLFNGTYGSADETGRLFADAAERAEREKIGLGTALGRSLLDRAPRYAEKSMLCYATSAGLAVTVHVGMGTDTVHMHPACRGDHVGASSHRDFLRLVTMVRALDQGVYLNVGSAVVLPEVFLKAVAMAHHGRDGERIRIVTGNLDMLRHYRTTTNVLRRPATKGFDIAGHHEIMVPLLRAAILHALPPEPTA